MIDSDQPKYGAWPYILPFMAFMLVSMFEPRFPDQNEDGLPPAVLQQAHENPDSPALSEADTYALAERRQLANQFFLTYGFKVLLTTGLLIFFWRIYSKQFPFSTSWLSVVVGAVGIVVWVGLCHLGIESALIGWFQVEDISMRSHFNPFAQIPEDWQLYLFLAIRFFGLVIMVPICEELLLRGLLMRYIESPDWWTISLGRLSFRTMLVAPMYGLATHPTEALAAVAWFSLVTWLVHRTGKFWDAVIAHAITNLLLGLYVCVFSQWQLW